MKKVKRTQGHSPFKKFIKAPYITNKTVELEQVFPPPNQRSGDEDLTATYERHNPFVRSKSNRCTYYRPSNEDFGQLTDMVFLPDKDYQRLLQEMCCDTSTSDTNLTELKNACQGSTIQTCSQFVEPASHLGIDEHISVDLMPDDSQWQTVDSVSDVDRLYLPKMEPDKVQSDAEKKSVISFPKNIRISETPRVKRIAEKFSKFTRNNIELRKLEERVVCLEYDIYDLNAADTTVPLQIMRAFFSIKTKEVEGKNDKDDISFIPSGVKRNFNIEDGDIEKLNKKEIEIIDGEIAGNRVLLEDLKRVLRRKQAIEHKKKQQTLDLMYLYEMAKRESPPVNEDYSNTNLLSKAELQEIKDLILKKCASSVHGINRKTVKCNKGEAEGDVDCVISDSLICELIREGKV